MRLRWLILGLTVALGCDDGGASDAPVEDAGQLPRDVGADDVGTLDAALGSADAGAPEDAGARTRDATAAGGDAAPDAPDAAQDAEPSAQDAEPSAQDAGAPAPDAARVAPDAVLQPSDAAPEDAGARDPDAAAEAPVHTVFVSSADLPSDLDGLVGADATCQALAEAAGRPGTWRAILSDSTVDARDHIVVRGPVERVDGARVAADAEDLWDGALDVRINLDERGQPVFPPLVWSGTDADGTADKAVTTWCGDWSGGGGGADIGRTDRDGAGWISIYGEGPSGHACGNTGRIYCIDLQEAEPAPGDAGVADAGADGPDAAPPDAAVGGDEDGVRCGPRVCPVGDICCITQNGIARSYECLAPDGDCRGGFFECDGQSDCGPGAECCGNGFASVCAAAGTCDALLTCGDAADICPEGTDCCEAPPYGLDVCSPGCPD